MPKGKAVKDKSEKKPHKNKPDKNHKAKHNKKNHKKDEAGKTDKKTASVEKHKEVASKRGQPSGPTACAEHGVWTDMTQVKRPPSNQQPLEFSSVDAEENQRILTSGKMSFAMVGCSGDPATGANTKAVAKAISEDKDLSFLYHLGDIIYTLSGSDTQGSEPVKPYSHSLWDDQFFEPYAKFPKGYFLDCGQP